MTKERIAELRVLERAIEIGTMQRILKECLDAIEFDNQGVATLTKRGDRAIDQAREESDLILRLERELVEARKDRERLTFIFNDDRLDFIPCDTLKEWLDEIDHDMAIDAAMTPTPPTPETEHE